MLIFVGKKKSMMLRLLYILFLSCLPILSLAQFAVSFSSSVRSPQMVLNDVWSDPPIMQLGSDDVILFSFDEMSHTYKRYIYRITHRNSDWTPSDLLEIDYLDGFNGMPVEEYENSVNTTQMYTHYSFTIPNENVSLKLSGNYRVEIFDDELSDEVPVLHFDFSVVETKVGIGVKVSGDTDRSLNDGEQQLSFVVDYSRYQVAYPQTDLKPVVYQNRCRYNAVSGLVPTYIMAGRAEYVHNDKLIFDAMNEYRRFELTDPNSSGMNVEEVVYEAPYYHAILYMDKIRASHSNYHDENGRFYVNTIEGRGELIEADYVTVHFALDAPYRSEGDYYIVGDFCSNAFSALEKLDYDAENGYYFTSRLLKLGIYNYMYAWLPDGASKPLFSFSEGNWYNTENEYMVYVYHRAFGERYDRLVGVQMVKYSMERN